MKKSILALSVLAASFLGAVEIDPAAAQVDFVGYKMQNKMAIPETAPKVATFKEATFNFPKTSGSVSEILTNSTVTINLNSIDTVKNAIRDKNIKDKLFKNLASQTVEAKIVSVTGDDAAGEAKANVKLNNVEKEVVLKYEVKDGKLKGMGQINLESDFGMADAYTKFKEDKMIQGLHGKKTWPEVEVGFEVPVK
ncbi:MAG: YceI family protein [Campylobacter sp.]|nr:YceI family protein [Campylobacter sp.]